MPIITIIIVLVVVGFLLWAATKWIPMDPRIRTILGVVVIVIVIIWLLQVTGIWAMLSSATVG